MKGMIFNARIQIAFRAIGSLLHLMCLLIDLMNQWEWLCTQSALIDRFNKIANLLQSLKHWTWNQLFKWWRHNVPPPFTKQESFTDQKLANKKTNCPQNHQTQQQQFNRKNAPRPNNSTQQKKETPVSQRPAGQQTKNKDRSQGKK